MWFLCDCKNSSIRRGWLVKRGFVKQVWYFYNNEYFYYIWLGKNKASWLFCGFRIGMHHTDQVPALLSFATVLYFTKTEPVIRASKSDKKPAAVTMEQSHLSYSYFKEFVFYKWLFRFTRKNSTTLTYIWPLKPHTPLRVSIFAMF